MKQQVLVIHGGTTFPNHKNFLEHLSTLDIDLDRLRYKLDWKESLAQDLGNEYDVFTPKMPNASNAQYDEWKIWFENILPRMHKDIILIGHSLGGAFLTRYLSENKVSNNIKALFLIATPYEAIEDEEYLGDFEVTTKNKPLSLQSNQIILFHSNDDKVVPVEQSKKLHALVEGSQLKILNNYGHINTEHFPELVSEIHTIML
jgi:predicted alpha/beta hydrolase family esterase